MNRNACYIVVTLLASAAVASAVPDRPQVQRGDIDAGAGVRPPRGVALGFPEGTLLFDADQLQMVSAWYDSQLDTEGLNYFGLRWKRAGGDAPDASWFPARALKIRMPGQDAGQDFALPLESDPNDGSRFGGYQIGATSVRLRYCLSFNSAPVQVTEDVRMETRPPWQGFVRSFTFTGLPAGARVSLELATVEPLGYFAADGAPAPTPDSAPMAGYRTADRPHVLVAGGSPGWRWETRDTSRQLVSAAARGKAPVLLRLDGWRTKEAQPAGPLSAVTLADFAANAPALNRSLDVPAEPIRSRPAPTQPPLQHQENVESFSPVHASRVRFNVVRTDSGNAPGIDEVEVYGPNGTENLARIGQASASSVIGGHAIHQIAHLNDGVLGNEHSWVAAEQRAWIQIEWTEPVEISKLVWARDRTGSCKDRLPIDYHVDVSTDGTNWQTVCDAGDHLPFARPGAPSAAVSPGYSLETIPLPFGGCRPSDLAFDGHGLLYLMEMTRGEIWRTKAPAPGKGGEVRWQLFARGLHHPIGMQVVDGRLYISQKPEITELVDGNGDGLAELYRTVATGWGLSYSFHEYTFGLAADAERNLWFALNTGNFWTHPGMVTAGRLRGSIMKVAHGTEKLTEEAKGCRVPNGITAGPKNSIFFTDNQGDWIQSCKLAHVVPGRFYGHAEAKSDALPDGQFPDGRSAVWLPYLRSHSSSGPVYDSTAGKFGPFAGQFFVGDVGYGSNPGVMRLALEQVNGEWQGAAFPFMDGQPVGCERMKFGPDERLYQASLSSGLTAVRFVGPAPLTIHSMHIRPGGAGFTLDLTQALPADTALIPAHFRFRRYHYLYTRKYGSPEADSQDVAVTAIELSRDRKRITLTLPVETYPIGMVYQLTIDPPAGATGPTFTPNQAWYTVNQIP